MKEYTSLKDILEKMAKDNEEKKQAMLKRFESALSEKKEETKPFLFTGFIKKESSEEQIEE